MFSQKLIRRLHESLSFGTSRVLTTAIRARKLCISIVCTNQEKLMRDAAINLRAHPEQREL
ncbi:MAG: hypothetical protein NT042_08030, partial [Sulfuritalea sp.]|nr:hypothetical protein [Sulfuritalea sp.]